MDLRLSKDDLQEARATIQGVTRHTPLFSSRSIGARTGLQVWLKAENLQKIGSFKPRGAKDEPAEHGHGEGRHHQQPEQILARVHESLKPGGKVLILEKLKEWVKDGSRSEQTDAHSLSAGSP